MARPKRICSFEGCEQRVKARGLCQGHLRQMDVHGELVPLRSYRKRTASLAAQVVAKPEKRNGWYDKKPKYAGLRKYSKSLHDDFVRAVRSGAPRVAAGALVGVAPETLRNWFQQAKQGVAPYDGLLADVEQAEAQLTLELIERVKQGGPSWAAPAWILERRFGADFGRKDHVTHGGDQEAPIQVLTHVLIENPAARRAHRELLTSLAASSRLLRGSSLQLAERRRRHRRRAFATLAEWRTTVYIVSLRRLRSS